MSDERAPISSGGRPGWAEMFTPKLVSVFREGYDLQALRADAVAGLTVAIVALPLSMAIAIACGLSPDKGLITAIVGGFLISALGGSRFQIGGPAGAFIVLVAAVLERHGADGLLLATFLAGLILMAIGFLRLGTYIQYIPFPVTVGFTAGIAVIIFASQIRDLLGLDLAREPAALLPKLAALWQAAGTMRPEALAVAAGTAGLVLALRRWRPTWPSFLLGIVAAGLAVTLLGLDVATIGSRFGAMPTGLPAPAFPPLDLARIQVVLPDAIAIALLGAIESLLSAVVADGMTGRRHRSNCELVAQGAANMAVSLFGGMPATGTIARTATNIRAGARGPVAGMLHALALLACLALAAPLMAAVPLAALAAVLAIVAWNMAERHEFLSLIRLSQSDATLVIVTFLLTILVDLAVAIGVGVTLGAFVFLHRMAEAVEVETGARLVPEDVADHAPDAAGKARAPYAGAEMESARDVVVYRISGAFFFGATSTVIATLERMGQRPRAFVFDLAGVPFIDSTAARALASFVSRMQASGVSVVVAGARPGVRQALAGVGLAEDAACFAPDVAAARRLLEAPTGAARP